MKNRSPLMLLAALVSVFLVYYIFSVFSSVYSYNARVIKKTPHVKIKNFLLQPHSQEGMKHNKNRKYSQARQDVTIYDILQKESGFFIEVGAHDGQFLSNTLWLERKHDWSGLLIEANPKLCKKIDALERHAWRFCACISDKNENVTFVDAGDIGGVESNMNKNHFKKVLNRNNTIQVPCFTLISVLDEIQVHHINYFSLDVEGGEMNILNTIKPLLLTGQIAVDVWTIEYLVFDDQKILVEESNKNLKKLRDFFQELGGYKEHSLLKVKPQDSSALDVVFISTSIKK